MSQAISSYFDLDPSRIRPKYLQAIFDSTIICRINWMQKQRHNWICSQSGLKILFDAKIPLPPLDEQRRIVARIEELAARIEEARELRRRAVEETDVLFKSVMKELFTFTGIDAQPISKLAVLKGGGTPSKSNPCYWEGDVPWISPKDMKSRELMDSLDHISETANTRISG